MERLNQLTQEIARVSVLEACILVANNQVQNDGQGGSWRDGARTLKEWADQVVRDALARGGGLPAERSYRNRKPRRPDG